MYKPYHCAIPSNLDPTDSALDLHEIFSVLQGMPHQVKRVPARPITLAFPKPDELELLGHRTKGGSAILQLLIEGRGRLAESS